MTTVTLEVDLVQDADRVNVPYRDPDFRHERDPPNIEPDEMRACVAKSTDSGTRRVLTVSWLARFSFAPSKPDSV